jgi:hypothetical protein
MPPVMVNFILFYLFIFLKLNALYLFLEFIRSFHALSYGSLMLTCFPSSKQQQTVVEICFISLKIKKNLKALITSTGTQSTQMSKP